MKNYVSLEEIMDIYSLSSNTVGAILSKYKIDNFKLKKWIVINLNDFHKVYTSKFNPTLFVFENKKKLISKKGVVSWLKFWDNNSLLLSIFSRPLFY